MSLRNVCALLALVAILASGAFADGMIFPVERPGTSIVIPDQLFTVKYHHVDVAINDQLCTTKVDQIFHNDTNTEREGMYIFPMPEGSAITKFSMYAGEQEIAGKILDRNEARDIYESIVRQRKDPAILEYIDRNTFRARVFPIPANGDKRIKLSYAEVAKKSGGLYQYVYPLSTERFSAKPLEDCRVTITIKCKKPILNVYSPTHKIDIDRPSPNEAIVTWEAKDTRPDTDMVLYYSVSNDDLGIDIITHKEPGEPGYFMLLASPRSKVNSDKVLPKNVLFVLDRTGSMAGEKIDQAKEALKFCVNTLREQDTFNVITFNETPNLIFDKLQKVTRENRKKALDEVSRLEADGGTDINEALKTARKQFAEVESSRNYIVFITDGQPTVGNTDPETILRNAKVENAKTFAFGVGYDVNTHLLDKLAEQNKGASDYVRPGENMEIKISSFFGKVSDPVLSDVSVDVAGVKISDSYPSKDLPDIFVGSQLMILGRYNDSGKVAITLKGKSGDVKQTYILDATFAENNSDNEFLPQLWASRKIGYLLDEIRLHSNQELIDEVVRLSKKYGIPTEYTSFLADERKTDADLKHDAQRIKKEALAAAKVKTGSYGVAQSTNASMSRNNAQIPAAAPSVSAGNTQVLGTMAPNGRIGGTYQNAMDETVVVANVQNVARRTFYQRGTFWEDADLKPDQKFTQIKQFSEAHFKLLKAYPKLSQYSTLGNVRVILENSNAVEIGPSGKEALSDSELKALIEPAKKK